MSAQQNLVHTKKVLALADRTLDAGKRARDCQWQKIFPDCEQMSITDELKKLESVRINEYELVIVNWDAANGDIITGSDDTLFYFMTRGEDRKNILLHNGGILLCEFQGGNKGILHQTAYDAIFGKAEIAVCQANLSEPNESRHGPTAQVVWQYRNHPIVKGLPKTLATHYKECGARVINFTPNVDEMYGFKYRASILWHGWFQWWKKGWIPLLTAELPESHPYRKRWFAPRPAVLLAKCEDNGLFLASSLWIAISNLQEVADKIRSVDISTIREFHNRVLIKRAIGDVAILIGLVGLFYLFSLSVAKLIALASVASLYSRFAPHYRGVIEDFGKTWLYILAVVFYLRWIWERPYGISPFKSLRPAFRSVREFFGI